MTSNKTIVIESEQLFLFKFRDGYIVYGRLDADTGCGRDVLEGREPRPLSSADRRRRKGRMTEAKETAMWFREHLDPSIERKDHASSSL
jgi:hypothetical protein